MPILILILAGAIYAGGQEGPRRRWLDPLPDRKRKRRREDAVGDNTHLPVLSRGEQLRAIALHPTELEPSAAERNINRRLILSAVALVLAALGAFFYAPLSLVSVLFIPYLSWPIWREAYSSLFKEHRLRVSVLDVIFILLGLYTANYLALALGGFLFYASRKLLIRTEERSRGSLVAVFGNLPRFAWVQIGGVEIEVPLKDVRANDIVLVHAGETVPVDGVIASGIASIDQHMLTGESQPAEKEAGDQVFASTVVVSGAIQVRAERSGDSTAVAQIGAILQRTADFKASIQSRGEAMADKSTPPFLALGAVALPLLGPSGAGSVLGASFGYHLRILAPIGMLNFLTLASRNGILVKDGRSLELLNQVDTVVFDKTGTLTLEQPQAGAIYACNGFDENQILRYAAMAEYKQTHPIARAILQEAEARSVLIPVSGAAQYEVGYGIKVTTNEQVVRVGSARYMALEGITIPPNIAAVQTECDLDGASLVYVALQDRLGGAIVLHATVRPEAKFVVESLRQRRMSVAIISGDREHPTRNLAHSLGVDRYYAETLPEDKAKLIAQLQGEGRKVCFVGDGINDAIALKQANTSISLRGASTAAVDSAQIILMDQSLHQVSKAFDIAREFDANMRFGFAMTIIPGLIGLWGAFFLRFGMVAPILLNNLGLAIGLVNAILPGWEAPTYPRLSAPAPGRQRENTSGNDDAATPLLVEPEPVGGQAS